MLELHSNSLISFGLHIIGAPWEKNLNNLNSLNSLIASEASEVVPGWHAF